MSQDYQHACERAELFGQPIPSEQEWTENEETSRQKEEHEIEEQENAVAQELDQSDETGKRMAGGLTELTSILNSTQRKINRFKTVCGSLGTMLKIRRGSRSSTPKSTPKHAPKEDNTNELEAQENIDDVNTISVTESTTVGEVSEQTKFVSNKTIDISSKMGSHLNKLDSLITKAENAQYSMSHQTKQMRRILK